jgi:hypothetical protein
MHSKIIWTFLNWEEPKMRSIAIVLATFVASAPAAAQGWKEYSYPDYAFSVAFPANPQVEQTTYQVTPGRLAPAWVVCHERCRSTRLRATVREMKEGPSGSAIRSLIPSHRELLRGLLRRAEELGWVSKG